MFVSITVLKRMIREALEDRPPTVYRGMTELTRAQVQALIHVPCPDEPSVIELNERVPTSQSRWWSPHRAIAMAYATTDPIRGQRPGERFDVLMIGRFEGDTTDALKQRGGEVTEQSIMVTHVLVAPRGKTRKLTMQGLLDSIHP